LLSQDQIQNGARKIETYKLCLWYEFCHAVDSEALNNSGRDCKEFRTEFVAPVLTFSLPAPNKKMAHVKLSLINFV
jgi:hypothetical protein